MSLSIRTGAALVALLPFACMAQGGATPSAPACDVKYTAFESRDVTCALDPKQHAGPWLFKVDFSGGHDDTLATMVVKVDDKPLACEGGGKLRLEGEDGDVSLLCRFPGPTSGTLQATVKFSHAEWVRAGLSAN